MIAERVVLTTTSDISVGAYHLDVHIVTSDSTTRLPIYQNDDTSSLDRVTLGYVAVPWQGELNIEQSVDANFGNEITLSGFEAADDLSPGAELDVTLYWEAQRPPSDNYVVFVHLLDGKGQAAASHDGPPMDGRYPTKAWLPGEIIPDVHHIALVPDIPAGTYWLKVGMYRWPSLEHLPVWDKQGIEQADHVIVLQSVEVQ